MKIGFITKEDPEDIRSYSGTHYFMLEALRNEFEQVIKIGPLQLKAHNLYYRGKSKVIRTLSGKVYRHQYDPGLCRSYSELIDHRVEISNPDVLIGSLVSPELAHCNTNHPLYLTSDATFPLLRGLYKSHTGLHEKTINSALKLEKRAFDKAKKLILPLKWLAESAVKDHGISRDKICIVPYGPNIPDEIPETKIRDLIHARQDRSVIRLLFVGVRWEEKGGNFAWKVAEELNRMQIPTELHVVGSQPTHESGKYLFSHGFLDKNDDHQYSRLKELYRMADLFLLPTKAECVGMSFIEASAYGLPLVGKDTGGVSETVRDGKNGFLITGETPENIAVKIAELVQNKEQYQRFSIDSYTRYREEKNWTRWASEVRKVIESDLL